MASSLRDATMGMSIIPMAKAAAKAVKFVSAWNKGLTMTGLMKEIAKKPKTTVGMPASTSRIGFTVDLRALGAYSLR